LLKHNFMASLLEREMFNYFTRLNEDEKKSVVQMLKSFLRSRMHEAVTIGTEQYNKEIDEALEEAKNGNFITQDKMEIRAAKW
jgi:hypothetical protein